MSSDIATRVARGVALLDEQAPGWDGQIDLIKLDVKSTDQCVLGQVFGGYNSGTEALGIDVGVSYGFEISEEGPWKYRSADRQYSELTEEWVRVLGVLRQKQDTQELVAK